MNFFSYIQSHQIILLFVIITMGYLIGEIKIWNFSLGTSAILFVAMLFGHYGFTLNHDFQVLGLILFIYAIGLQAGPVIFNMSKKQGLRLYSIVLFLLFLGALSTYFAALFWQIKMNLAVGLFSGAMTSTPGLAAALESAHSGAASTGYGVAYPFGVIGVILFIKILPALFRTNLKKEEALVQSREKQSHEEVVRYQVQITNASLDGKSLKELNLAHTTGTIISRILRNGQLLVPGAETTIRIKDIICLVGDKSKVETTVPFLGKKSKQKLPETRYFESRKFVVTNKAIVGKRVADLNLNAYFRANITRIRRSGMEFTAEPDQRLQWGDRVRVAGDAGHMNDIRRLFGDEMKKLEYGNTYAIIVGILFGIVLGLIPFSIGKVISFNLGITGGVLLAGLFLSNRGKIGPVIWLVPAPVKNFMRELGLTLFLAVVGIKAGAEIVNTLQQQGIKLLLIGAFITLVPMIITTILARLKYKMLLIELFGILSGGMTSTPGLAAGANMTDSQMPLVLYATVYPFAMIMMMALIKILMVLS